MQRTERLWGEQSVAGSPENARAGWAAGEETLDQRGLADAGFAAHENELPVPRRGPKARLVQHPQVVVALQQVRNHLAPSRSAIALNRIGGIESYASLHDLDARLTIVSGWWKTRASPAPRRGR